MMLKVLTFSLLFFAFIISSTREIRAQTTEFTFQGSLKNSSIPANGNFDFEFKLFDAVSGGSQQGTTIQILNVTVANGIYAVRLDFGASALPGADRFLDIAVRTAGGGAFTPLAPRQKITSSPYAVRSLSAAQADSVNVTGVPAGSGNYIQNQNAVYQPGNFTINGQGAASIFRAETQFNIGGERVLSTGNAGFNLFAGVGAGQSNTTGFLNAFFGYEAGFTNTGGLRNAFFGPNAGHENTTGQANSFFGYNAGYINQTASGNSYFGNNAGNNRSGNNNSIFGSSSNINIAARSGDFNSFFGHRAGEGTAGGNLNTFIGTGAGFGNTNGSSNTFVGHDAGNTNSSGIFNTVIGENADVLNSSLTNATAIGSKALVGASNSLVLGSINGFNGATADTNVGIGTTTPQYRLHVVGENVRVEGNTNSIFPRFSLNFTGGNVDEKKWQNYAGPGTLNFSVLNDNESTETFWMQVNRGTGATISNVFFPNGNVGIGVTSPDKLAVNGTISFATLGPAGGTQLCRNASNQIASCSSSLRYKTNIGAFSNGMSFIRQLRPISFDWKDGGMKDVGFGAEDVAKIDPRFVTYNSSGEVEGVKYDRLSTVLVNAVKEQQTQIEAQQKQITALTQALCSLNPELDICKPNK